MKIGGVALNHYDEYEKQIKTVNNNIKYYQLLITACNDPCQKIMYENLLNDEISRYYQLYNQYLLKNNMNTNEGYEISKSNMRQFTVEELSLYDGSNGRPAYVAVNGIVYDVSLEATWGGGTHFSMYAGHDLTSKFNACHVGRTEALRNLPQIGLLISS